MLILIFSINQPRRLAGVSPAKLPDHPDADTCPAGNTPPLPEYTASDNGSPMRLRRRVRVGWKDSSGSDREFRIFEIEFSPSPFSFSLSFPVHHSSRKAIYLSAVINGESIESVTRSGQDADISLCFILSTLPAFAKPPELDQIRRSSCTDDFMSFVNHGKKFTLHLNRTKFLLDHLLELDIFLKRLLTYHRSTAPATDLTSQQPVLPSYPTETSAPEESKRKRRLSNIQSLPDPKRISLSYDDVVDLLFRLTRRVDSGFAVLHSRVDGLDSRFVGLDNRVDGLDSHVDELDSAQCRYDSEEREHVRAFCVDELDDQLQSTEAACYSVDQEHTYLIEKVASVEESVEAAKEEVRDELVERQEEGFQQLEKQFKGAEEQIGRLKSEVTRAKEGFQRLRKQVRSIKEQVGEVGSDLRLEAPEAEIRIKQEVRKEVGNIRQKVMQRINVLQEKHKVLQEKHSALQGHHNILQEQHNALQGQHNLLREQHDVLQEQLKNLEQNQRNMCILLNLRMDNSMVCGPLVPRT